MENNITFEDLINITSKVREGNDSKKLERIKAARKALRRKYATRNTIDKIFEKYDSGSKGFIDAQDLYNQANINGITISLDEA